MNYKIKLASIYKIVILWAIIPVMIFILFWYRWYYAYPVIILGIYCSIRILRNTRHHNPFEYIPINAQTISLLLFLFIWMLLIGIGGFWAQEHWDNGYRNAVLYELVSKPWPVVDITGEKFSYLSYYFSYWLPAAAVGKLFSSYSSAQTALFVYSYIGMATAILMVIFYCKKRMLLIGILFLLCGGVEIFPQVIFRFLLHWHDNFAAGTDILTYPNPLYLCRYIYNQGIPAIVILLLMYLQRNKPGVQLFFFALIFTLSPFVALPVAFILAGYLIRNFKQSFTPENLFGFISCLLVSVFMLSNVQGASASNGTIFNYYPINKVILLIFTWIIFNFGIFMPFIWKDIKKNSFYWLLLIFTIFCAIPVPGYGNFDFGWKVPTAFSLFTLLLILKAFAASGIKWETTRQKLFIIAITLSLISQYGIIIDVLRDNYKFLFTNERELVKRNDSLNGKIFDRDSIGECYHNFVADSHSFYSDYFMPKHTRCIK